MTEQKRINRVKSLRGKYRDILTTSDERKICNEWEELAKMRGAELMQVHDHIEELTRKLKLAESSAARWRETAKMGMPEIIQKWMDWLEKHSILELEKSGK